MTLSRIALALSLIWAATAPSLAQSSLPPGVIAQLNMMGMASMLNDFCYQTNVDRQKIEQKIKDELPVSSTIDQLSNKRQDVYLAGLNGLGDPANPSQIFLIVPKKLETEGCLFRVNGGHVEAAWNAIWDRISLPETTSREILKGVGADGDISTEFVATTLPNGKDVTVGLMYLANKTDTEPFFMFVRPM